MSNDVRCNQGKRDCFAYRDGLCRVLNGTFDYDCPFYKTRQQHKDDVAKCRKRLLDIKLLNVTEATYKVRIRP